MTLRALELKLLRHFMEHPTVVFSRRQLLEAVWMNTQLEEGAVTALVKRLRETLSPLGGTHRIRTVHSVGYTFDADVRARHERAGAR